jgi:hypothetical protein
MFERKIVVAPAKLVFFHPFAGSKPPSNVRLLVIVVIGLLIVYVPIAILIIVPKQAALTIAALKVKGSVFDPSAVSVPVVETYNKLHTFCDAVGITTTALSTD